MITYNPIIIYWIIYNNSSAFLYVLLKHKIAMLQPLSSNYELNEYARCLSILSQQFG